MVFIEALKKNIREGRGCRLEDWRKRQFKDVSRQIAKTIWWWKFGRKFVGVVF